MLIINLELKELIPPLQLEEYKLLEKSIIEEGCRDSLVIWGNTIIDGHNRYEICNRNNIEFSTKEMSFESIGEVKIWMIDNQLARRNLTDSLKRYYIGKRYEEDKKVVTNEKGINQRKVVVDHFGLQPNTAKEIGKKYNIGQSTVKRNEQYSKAIDKIKEDKPDLANQILTEEIRLTNKEVIEMAEGKNVHVSNNSGNNEWYTPTKYIEIARDVMNGIDVDPATSKIANRNVKAKTIYTIDDDGLIKEWIGNVWLNPPYAQPLIQQFADKLIEEIDNGNVKQAMVLVNNATETKWFNTLSKKAEAIWFMRGRVKFIDGEGKSTGAPLQGQCILYFGGNIDKFISKCEGLVCRCNYE